METPSYKKTYQKLGADFYLTSVELFTGDKVLIERFTDGRIAKVSHEDKFIQFKWSEGERPRLVSVVDNAGRRVEFVHREGLLQSVKTVSGGKWAYSYKNGKLVKVINPLGNTELEVRYDGERVVRTSNEAGFKRYSYAGRATTVMTSEAYSQTFEHNANGLVRRIYDGQGVLAEIAYDDAHRVKLISDGKKVVASFEYDAEGKVAAINENGVKKSDGSEARAEVKRFGKVDLVKSSGRDIESEEKGKTRVVSTEGDDGESSAAT